MSPDSIQMREFVFDSAPFASCHASTIVELRNGDLLTAWFAGKSEGSRDVAIWASGRSAGHWSAPMVLAREINVATWNPVLFHTRNDLLWLYYKFGKSPETWRAKRMWSDDEGDSWSTAEPLPPGLYGPVRAKPLMLNDGIVVSGSSTEDSHSW